MLHKIIIATALFITPFVGQQQAFALDPASTLPAGIYKLEPTHASLTWKVSHMGLSNYTARFTKMDATLNLDTQDPTKSTLVATVDPASVKTDYPNAATKDFDKELATGETWFNAGKFPEIKYVSTSVVKTGENTATINGELTFMGVTKPLALAATYNGGMKEHPFTKTATVGFSATAVLKRSDWGFSTYVPTIGDEVTLLIETEFVKAN